MFVRYNADIADVLTAVCEHDDLVLVHPFSTSTCAKRLKRDISRGDGRRIMRTRSIPMRKVVFLATSV